MGREATGLACTSSEENAERPYYSLVEAARADGLEILTVRGRDTAPYGPEREQGSLTGTRKKNE